MPASMAAAAAASSSYSALLTGLRPKPQTLALHLRLFSSKSSSPLSPPTTPEPPETPPFSSSSSSPSPSSSTSPLSEIKSRLRHPSTEAEPRRIPLNPRKPDLLSSAPSPSSLDEIRRNLAEFRRRSSPPPPSLQDLYSNFRQREGKPDEEQQQQRPSFDQIRQSLRKLSTPFRDNQRIPSPLSRERLDVSPRDENTTLSRSIFGREMTEGDNKENERNTEFLRMYTYEELGEKLRALRPEEKEGKASPFSLEELNERLARLREEEDKASDSKFGGVSFRELRNSLLKLKDAETNKKRANMSSILIGPQTLLGKDINSPDYMQNPPKDHLVEKYIHPDLMSSAERLKLELQRVRDEFKMSESDCGSARVQVAQLTTKIKHLSAVLHKKDKSSQRGLQQMIQDRKKHLRYLRRTDWDSYCMCLSKLGLRDAAEHRSKRRWQVFCFAFSHYNVRGWCVSILKKVGEHQQSTILARGVSEFHNLSSIFIHLPSK